jgi:RimJ/RimL family protein N-acetyltransferase
MDESIWPPFGLRLRSGDLELRIPQDDDLPGLIALAKQGIHDPAEMPFTVPWTDQPSPALEHSFVQHYWGQRAALSAASWSLPFMVSVAGELAGVQDVRAEQFSALRTVDTGSWLARRMQNRGLGTRMREAALAFAFDHLGAVRAQSCAFHDNLSSQQVSRKLGYVENGTVRLLRRGLPVAQVRFVMEREQWRSRQRPAVDVAGLEACRGLLGLQASDR